MSRKRPARAHRTDDARKSKPNARRSIEVVKEERLPAWDPPSRTVARPVGEPRRRATAARRAFPAFPSASLAHVSASIRHERRSAPRVRDGSPACSKKSVSSTRSRSCCSRIPLAASNIWQPANFPSAFFYPLDTYSVFLLSGASSSPSLCSRFGMAEARSVDHVAPSTHSNDEGDKRPGRDYAGILERRCGRCSAARPPVRSFAGMFTLRHTSGTARLAETRPFMSGSYPDGYKYRKCVIRRPLGL